MEQRLSTLQRELLEGARQDHVMNKFSPERLLQISEFMDEDGELDWNR